MPVAPTVAIAGDTDDHVPPALPVRSVKGVVDDGHTLSTPVIAPAFGAGFTVTTAVAAAVPQLLVTA